MKFHVILALLFFSILSCYAEENMFILNDICSQTLYQAVENSFAKNDKITVIREVRGVIFRIKLERPAEDFYNLTPNVRQEIKRIKDFLAKIKNPAIIEVHTSGVPEGIKLKNWEFSTLIANKIADVFTREEPKMPVERLYVVGYGEFMPDKNNTSNNGGKESDRVDIIILCNENGE